MLLKMHVTNRQEPGEFAFIHYMGYRTPLQNVKALLGCSCVRLNRVRYVDHTVESLRGPRTKNKMRTEEWFGMEPQDSIQEAVNVMNASKSIKQSKSGLLWPQY